MHIVTCRITDLDYCLKCHGIFFDKGEFGWVANDERAGKADLADAAEVLFYVVATAADSS